MRINKRAEKKFNRKQKLLQVASSAYSGSTELCGDSYSWELLPDGRFAAALSDGMGKGNLAARESSRAVNSVIALLKAGMDPEMALQVLNILWTASNRKELFPTMDLALLDRAGRELMIYKIGAAPTVIIRSPRCRQGNSGSAPPEKTEILTAPAMPMGVSENSEIPCISTLVMPGDRVIMMTDGIADSNRDDPDLKWLQRLLSCLKSRSHQTVCDLIIREAALNYGCREKDDMAAVVFGIK
jgi:stage II sporulation protein E